MGWFFYHSTLVYCYRARKKLDWYERETARRSKAILFLGMRFFRIARILNIPDILQFLHILRSSNSIRLTRMLCLLFTVWFSAAGFVHLVLFAIDHETMLICVYIGREFRRFLSKLFKFPTDYILSMCLLSDRHNEVRRERQKPVTWKRCPWFLFVAPLATAITIWEQFVVVSTKRMLACVWMRLES